MSYTVPQSLRSRRRDWRKMKRKYRHYVKWMRGRTGPNATYREVPFDIPYPTKDK